MLAVGVDAKPDSCKEEEVEVKKQYIVTAGSGSGFDHPPTHRAMMEQQRKSPGE